MNLSLKPSPVLGLPADWYHRADVFEREGQAIFARQWQGHADELIVVDDHITGVLTEHQAGRFLAMKPAGIRVRGQTRGLVFKNNIIRDTRPLESRKQAVGIRIEEAAGEVVLEDNKIEARTNVEDQRKSRP